MTCRVPLLQILRTTLWPVAAALVVVACGGSGQLARTRAVTTPPGQRTFVCSRNASQWPDRPEHGWTAIAFFTRLRPAFVRITGAETGGDTMIESFSDRMGPMVVERYPAQVTFIGGRFHAQVKGSVDSRPFLELEAKISLGGSDPNAVLTQRAPDQVDRPEATVRTVLILDKGPAFFQRLRTLHDCSTGALASWRKGT